MASFPSIYRARAMSIKGDTVQVFVPQVFGEQSISITTFLGGAPSGPTMGWVMFQGGNPEFPVWAGNLSGGAPGGGGGAGDEVWIGPTNPGFAYEMWYDTDATGGGGGGGGGDGKDEVWIGDAAPVNPDLELWYDPDAPTPPPPAPAGMPTVVSATYTPSVSAITFGAGSIVEATYTYIGGSVVGDKGILWLNFRAVFGTGLAIAGGANPLFGLPAGFAWTDSGDSVKGNCAFFDANTTNDYPGTVMAWTNITFRLMTDDPVLFPIGATHPIPWAVSDSMRANLCAGVVRV